VEKHEKAETHAVRLIQIFCHFCPKGFFEWDLFLKQGWKSIT